MIPSYFKKYFSEPKFRNGEFGTEAILFERPLGNSCFLTFQVWQRSDRDKSDVGDFGPDMANVGDYQVICRKADGSEHIGPKGRFDINEASITDLVEATDLWHQQFSILFGESSALPK